ncbi:MAG TPA: glycoside hydrolase family 3 C-terminal domain-containing protein [Polyangiaceae bacterium]|nr:glycoside hydrolase family 3 C-terminal domain-containing protein [Polyangiaceae bacterium]
MGRRGELGFQSGRAISLVLGASLWSVAFTEACGKGSAHPDHGAGGVAAAGGASAGATTHEGDAGESGSAGSSEGGTDAGEGGNAGDVAGGTSGKSNSTGNGGAGSNHAGNGNTGGANAGSSGNVGDNGGVGGNGGSGNAGNGNAGGGSGGTGTLDSLDLSNLAPSVLNSNPDPPGLAAAQSRAAALLATLSQTQKLTLIRGNSGNYVGNVAAVGSIPALTLQDGPAGVRYFSGVTGFPAPITLAASWDRELVESWGTAMGAEHRGKGVMIALGPMMNLARVPAGGRNFEGFGEDPYLAAELAARDVAGIQSQKVVATAKHFVGNEQETNRFGGNSQIDARTLHEVYYAPFEASVRAGLASVMCSYNRLNGVYACEHPSALADLKAGMGFSGWVMSDWSAAQSTVASANAGLDMEMPYGSYFSSLATAISGGSVAQARLDDMVLRILTALIRVGILDDPPTGTGASNINPSAHTDLARRAATSGITLLKNQNQLLPLDPSKKIAVIGRAGHTAPAFGGGGSAAVTPPYIRSPFTEIQLRSGSTVTYTNGTTSDAALAASAADVAIVFGSVDSTEGFDRSSLDSGIDPLVSAVASANPNTIVVLNVPGAVLMPWLDQVAAVVVAWYPGQENGKAITPILFGDENPSGKLPVTFPKSASDLPQPSSAQNVAYTEGLAMGYRALDAANIAPLFPFGYGLSYTTFDYTGLELYPGNSAGSVAAQFKLTNSGARAGAEVAQLYLSYPADSGEPPRVLRGFERVVLAPGESKTVRIELDARALSTWDAGQHARHVSSGTYHVAVGSSSRDLPLEATLQVHGTDATGGSTGGTGGTSAGGSGGSGG